MHNFLWDSPANLVSECTDQSHTKIVIPLSCLISLAVIVSALFILQSLTTFSSLMPCKLWMDSLLIISLLSLDLTWDTYSLISCIIFGQLWEFYSYLWRHRQPMEIQFANDILLFNHFESSYIMHSKKLQNHSRGWLILFDYLSTSRICKDKEIV